MPFFSGDEIVEPNEEWLASDSEWEEIPDWLIEEVITAFLADADAGEYF